MLRRQIALAWWILSAGLCFCIAGCTSLNSGNESIVQVETRPKDTAKAMKLTLSGIKSLHLKQIDLAETKFLKAIAHDFSYGPAHSNLGLMHYEQGNLYQAVSAFETAREFMPRDPAVAYNLGLALESAGRTEEALELYSMASAAEPANPNFLGNLCRLRVRLGERDDLLRMQLQDLVLIETRPDWRRWADKQLALHLNLALDRGPETPDLDSALSGDEPDEQARLDLKDKIIDLTPVTPASSNEIFDQPPEDAPSADDLPDEPSAEMMQLMEPKPETENDLRSVLRDDPMEEVSVEDYYRER